MGRVSRCDKLTEHDRQRLVRRIGEGIPWRILGDEFKIPFVSIVEWAGRNGHGRTPTAAKRSIVETLMAMPETERFSEQKTERCECQSENLTEQSEHDIRAAAQEDVRDMRLGLHAARLALQVSAMGLEAMRDSGDLDPRNAKLWSECVAINVNTIRKIRGLDDTGATANITIANPRSFD